MAKLTITNNDLGSVILCDAVQRDEILAFPGADTYLEGTLLGRREVVTAITPVADVGNTGDGTFTAAAVVAGPVPMVGTYEVECITAAAHGGTFKLVDPNGATLASDLVMTAGAGVATVFVRNGITITITDGAADFIVGDSSTVPIVADGDMVVYAAAGVGGAQFPISVLTYEEIATGAADVAARALASGRVRKERLVIDGSAAGVGITDAIIDQLRDFGIVAVDVQELNDLDNQ